MPSNLSIEISKIINQVDNIEVKPSLIQPSNEIKSLGTFKVKINLHSEVQAEIKIKVISEDNIKKLIHFFPHIDY